MFEFLTPALIALGASDLGAACPSRGADLQGAVNGANAAFASMDESAFQRERDLARELVACLGEALTPVDSAALHRLEAFDAFLSLNSVRTVQAFKASLDIQPSFLLSDSIAPQGSPLAIQYETARSMAESPLESLSSGSGALLVIDGAFSSERPTARPALIQLLTVEGDVTWSGYLWPGSELPADLRVSGPSDDRRVNPVLPPVLPLPSKRYSRPLLGGALGGAALAGALYGWSWARHQEWVLGIGTCTSGGCRKAPEQSQAELERVRKQTNTLLYSSAGIGVVALGVGASAFIWVEW